MYVNNYCSTITIPDSITYGGDRYWITKFIVNNQSYLRYYSKILWNPFSLANSPYAATDHNVIYTTSYFGPIDTSINVPEPFTTLAAGVFYQPTKAWINSVTLPNTLTTINDNAFKNTNFCINNYSTIS